MKKISFLILLFSISFSSFAQDSKIRKQSFDNYRQLDSTSYILIPIQWDNNPKVGDMKVSGVGSNQNIFFYDPETDEQRFLFEGRLQIIKRYDGHLLHSRYRNDSSKRPLNKEHIYYTVISKDYNSDKKLNYEDPQILYMSKFDGTGLTQLTPDNYDLQKYKYIEKSHIILATMTVDDNNDGKFNSNDSEVLYRIDLNDLKNSKEIVKLRLKVNQR